PKTTSRMRSCRRTSATCSTSKSRGITSGSTSATSSAGSGSRGLRHANPVSVDASVARQTLRRARGVRARRSTSRRCYGGGHRGRAGRGCAPRGKVAVRRPKVLSLGGGLDSWAMLLDAEIRGELPDVVAFVDVGDPEDRLTHPGRGDGTYRRGEEG